VKSGRYKMSRIGKMPITISDDVKINIEGQKINISGPKGALAFVLEPEIEAKLSNNEITLVPKTNTKSISSIFGTSRTLLNNAVIGVRKGFEKKLEIHGVGYKAVKQGEDLVLSVGFAHPVNISAPKGIEFQVQKNQIIVSGIDKKQVGEIAAKIRNARKVEPYKGKGIRYIDEVVKKKVGKKAKAALGEGGGEASSQ